MLTVASGAADAMAPAALQQAYGQLPLDFEANQGQADSQVDFLARGAGYTLYLTGNGAVLDLRRAATSSAGGGSTGAHATGQVSGTVIEMQFVGANPNASLTGLDKQQAVSNYFVGSEPSQWRTGIANYGQIEYRHLYAGINASFHGDQGQLEYDFNLAPGADPNQIQLQIAGAEGLSLDARGELLIHTALGDLVEKAPSLYQTAGGQRVEVSGRFTLEGAGRVGFAVGSYDPSLPLVIDPTIDYSTYLGGSGDDAAYSVAVDSSGNAYITGFTASTNFPTTVGAFQTSLAGDADAFVAKLSASGAGLVYSTYLGGGDADVGRSVAVDDAGNAYLAGETASSNFPTTPGALQPAFAGDVDAFVAKLSAAGGSLLYSTYLGGTGVDEGTNIAVDDAGDAYISGLTESFDFLVSAGAFQTILAGNFDAFATKLNAAGSALIYSTYLGGSGQEDSRGIAIDSAGNAYLTGLTFSMNFPVTLGAFQTTLGGSDDAYVTKLNATGSAAVYSTYLGGSDSDEAFGIALDGAGDAFVTGGTRSTNFPTTSGAFQTALGGGLDAFVSKLSAAGESLVYSTYLGGGGSDPGIGIALDSAGDVLLSGFTDSTNFPITPGAFQTTFAGGGDAYMTKLNALGGRLIYSTYLGGGDYDQGGGVAVDSMGNAYVAGGTYSPDFPATADAFQPSLGGASDAFVAKFLTAATHNQQFISLLYHDLLHREADPSGLTFWDAQLTAGASRVQVALGIEQTTEFKQLVVNGLYLHFLHRVADASGLSFFTQLLNQGATLERVEALIIGSGEYFADQGGSNDGFLNGVYQDVLGRPIDPTGLAWWNSLLAAGFTRTQVASLILSTDEYRQQVVQTVYQQLLRRTASAADLAYWVGILRGGASDQQLAAYIAGSDEYYADAA